MLRCACEPDTLLLLLDAQRVVCAENQVGNTNSLWLNDEIMSAHIDRLNQLAQTKASRIHIHNVFTVNSLYTFRLGPEWLRKVAIKLAFETRNWKAMSRFFISIIVVNLYNDHWYILAIYPQEKKIDCLNWFETCHSDVNLLCHLLHVYLWAHNFVDDSGTLPPFNSSEWTFHAINAARIPRQMNGYDCGVFSLQCLDYLIAGHSMTVDARISI